MICGSRFCIIDEYNSNYYTFLIDGEEYYAFEKEPRNQGIEFTWNELIRNSIWFKKIQLRSL